MPDPVQSTDWTAIVTIVVTNLAGILTALAILISVIKGKFNILTEKVDGWKQETLNSIKQTHETKGKVDALIENPPIQTQVIQDRRKE